MLHRLYPSLTTNAPQFGACPVPGRLGRAIRFRFIYAYKGAFIHSGKAGWRCWTDIHVETLDGFRWATGSADLLYGLEDSDAILKHGHEAAEAVVTVPPVWAPVRNQVKPSSPHSQDTITVYPSPRSFPQSDIPIHPHSHGSAASQNK